MNFIFFNIFYHISPIFQNKPIKYVEIKEKFSKSRKRESGK